jgi:hypothetical protein
VCSKQKEEVALDSTHVQIQSADFLFTEAAGSDLFTFGAGFAKVYKQKFTSKSLQAKVFKSRKCQLKCFRPKIAAFGMRRKEGALQCTCFHMQCRNPTLFQKHFSCKNDATYLTMELSTKT